MGDIEVWISIVALMTALYAAISSRRSANASERAAKASVRSADSAERSAMASEGLVSLRRYRVREHWVSKLSEMFPDYAMVERVLVDLPPYLRPEWKTLVLSAARRSETLHLESALPILEEQHFPRWETMMRQEDENE